ncbi:MAG: hypothetical protein JJE09_07720 [Bacteroidia bacterium]|nr:hypothetical protein [Bacteroidia bacterium]
MDSPMYILTQIGFGLITVVFIYLFLAELKKGLAKSTIEISKQDKIFNRSLLGILLWTVFISAWSMTGMMGNFSIFPFNVLPVIAIPLITILVIIFSKTFGEIIIHVLPQNIIRLQTFRILVEVLLWALFIKNLVPIQMTFEGLNFDVLSGISAMLIAYLVSKQSISKRTILIWNILCLGLLVNIVVIAILSMPSPLRYFMNEPSNTIVTQFPISLLPGLLVPLAYTLHFFSMRQQALIK